MLVFITQREDKNKYDSIIDSLERNYIDFFRKTFYSLDKIIVLPNNPEIVDYMLSYVPDLIVFTGGGDVGNQPNRDKVESILLRYAIFFNVPVFGICRGMQFINYYFGGTLEKNNEPKKHEIDIINQSFVQGGKKGFVNSYHNFAVTKQSLSKELEPFAVHKNVIEGFIHSKYPIIGVQWHPERDDGLSSWIDYVVIDNLKRRMK